jgi:rhomboid protease GluP
MPYRKTLLLANAQTPVALALIGLNVLVFGLEILWGGSENPDTLYHLGALIPELVWQGEWWRLLAATFLHFGGAHLITNMLALFILGPFAELTLGTWKFLATYLTAGVGSMLTVTLLAVLTQSPTQMVVGASGAIMGLIGAEAAILVTEWYKRRSPLLVRRLRRVAFIVFLQSTFDLIVPQVSFTGHVSGLIVGFCVTGLLQTVLAEKQHLPLGQREIR